MTKKTAIFAIALALTLIWTGLASATIVALGPFTNPARWPAAAKVNAFYGNPDTVISLGVAQEVDARWSENIEDFDSSSGTSAAAISQESVFVAVGTQPGKWKIVFMIEHEATWSQGNEGGGDGELGLERAYASMKIPGTKTWWITVGNRIAGAQLQPLVWVGDNHGVQLNGSWRKNMRWEFAYNKVIENQDIGGIGVGVISGGPGNEATSGPLSFFGPLGTGNSSNGTRGDNDQDVWTGYIDWRPDKQHIRPFFVYNRDYTERCNRSARFTGGCVGLDAPDVAERQLNQFYIGVDGRWKIGPTKLDTSVIYMGGNLERAGGFEGNLRAWHLFADWRWPLGRWTPHLGFSYSSGDDDPTDDDLEGFSLVTNVQPVTHRGWGGPHRVVGESPVTPTAAGFFAGRTHTVDMVGPAPFNSTADGIGAQNPGLWAVNFGVDIQASKKLLIDSNITYFQYVDADDQFMGTGRMLGTLAANVPGATAGENELFWEWNIGATYRYSRNFFMNAAFGVLVPISGGAVQQIYGEDDTAAQLYMEAFWRF